MMDSTPDGVDPAYAAFLDEVVEAGMVWGLSDDEGWALAPSADDDQVMVMPFWASEEHARACASGEWEQFVPEPVVLDFFMEEWLPGMDGDGLRVGVAWDAALEGVEVPPLELQADLEATILDRSESDSDEDPAAGDDDA